MQGQMIIFKPDNIIAMKKRVTSKELWDRLNGASAKLIKNMDKKLSIHFKTTPPLNLVSHVATKAATNSKQEQRIRLTYRLPPTDSNSTRTLL